MTDDGYRDALEMRDELEQEKKRHAEHFRRLGGQPGHMAEAMRRDPTASFAARQMPREDQIMTHAEFHALLDRLQQVVDELERRMMAAIERIATLEAELSEARAAAHFVRQACTCARVSQSDIDGAVKIARAMATEVRACSTSQSEGAK